MLYPTAPRLQMPVLPVVMASTLLLSRRKTKVTIPHKMDPITTSRDCRRCGRSRSLTSVNEGASVQLTIFPGSDSIEALEHPAEMYRRRVSARGSNLGD